MPCLPISNGFLCIGNEPVEINYYGKHFLFEWTEWCGWLPVNRDGSERLSAVPKAVWERISTMPHSHKATEAEGSE